MPPRADAPATLIDGTAIAARVRGEVAERVRRYRERTGRTPGLATVLVGIADYHRHLLARGAQTAPVRETGSSVYAVFDGSGTVTVGETTWPVTRGDLFVVPSWQPFSVRSEAGATESDSGALDLFRFSDSPVSEALNLARTEGGAR